MKIYLDIDGTMIHEDGHKAGQPAVGLEEFIRALFPKTPHTHTTYPYPSSYDVYWLTTHCMEGDPVHARKIMKSVLPEELQADIERIKPTKWEVLKTEAIDFTGEFIWFDNDVLATERDILKMKALKDKQWLVEVDLEANPERLLEIVKEYFT